MTIPSALVQHQMRSLTQIIAATMPIVGLRAALSGTDIGPGNVQVDPPELQSAAQSIIDAFDWSPAAQDLRDTLRERADAQVLLSVTDAQWKLLRGVAAVLVDEINALRDEFTAQAAAVAAATSLADLKTRWAALPSTPDRTLAQAKTAIFAKIDSGAVDT